MNRWTVIALALVVGFWLLSYDRRTDDTGIEVALLVGSALALTAIAPRAGWAIALAVGLPIAVYSGVLGGNGAAVVAIVFSSVGAGIGYAMRRSPLVTRPG